MKLENPGNQEFKWKRILLIKPNYRSPGWDFYNVNFPPINLSYLASYLTDLKIKIKILDTKVKNLNYSQIRSEIMKFNPDLVGISVYVSATIEICYEIAKITKEVNSKSIIVFGGRHVTFEPDETLKNENVDIIVRGEGELTFRELIIKGTPEELLGISYKKNGKIIHNPNRPLMDRSEYERIRSPARCLIRGNKYELLTVRFETIETSRGCPFNCKFCTTHIINQQRWRPRPIEHIITELKMISKEKKITDIFFVDDNLAANPKRIVKLCERIIECKKNCEINDFKFFAQVRVEDIVKNISMVKKMSEAGFWVVFIGIESVNESTLKDLKKGLSVSRILQALKILHQNNVIVVGNLIIGLDLFEDFQNIKKQIDLMKKVNVDIVTFVLLTPFPGSDSLKELEAAGLVLTKDWSKYTVLYPVIKTYRLNRKQLQYLLHYSFKKLKYINNWKGLLYRAYKTRGLMFFMNLRRLVSFFKSFLKLWHYIRNFQL